MSGIMLKLSALAIALLALTSAPLTSVQLPTSRELSGAEFPPQDVQLWLLQHQGLTVREAMRRLADAPDSPDTLRWLVRASDTDGVLTVLRRIVDARPSHIADALGIFGGTGLPPRGDDELSQRRAALFRQIFTDARQKLSALPKEEAARAERILMLFDGGSEHERRTRLEAFIDKYRGTETALLAEVDVIAYGVTSQETLDALEAFIRAHPGTTAAARALHSEGSYWHTINSLGTLEPQGADPIHRFTRVLRIVKELESGRYPRSEWTEGAPDLISQFFIPDDARIAPESLDQFLAAYREFVRTHFVMDDESPHQDGIGYVVLSKIADLFELKGERIAGMERLLAELEGGGPDPDAVAYLRGLFYMQRWGGHSPAEQQSTVAKAREALAALSARGTGLYHRKALATLASLEFEDRDFRKALATFRKSRGVLSAE